MDLIRRASRTFASLVIATVFGCAIVSVLGMLAVYGVLLLQGEPMAINPGVLAGAMMVGAMRGATVLLVTVPLGALLHFGLVRLGQTGFLLYALAGLVTAAAAALALGVVSGFDFSTSFVIMDAASGLLGGCLFWIARRPTRKAEEPLA